jgi:hypothetical protein
LSVEEGKEEEKEEEDLRPWEKDPKWNDCGNSI